MNNSLGYYTLPAEEIYKNIKQKTSSVFQSEIEGIRLFIHPQVYPSNQFRTTSFLLNNLRDLFKDKKICDMGCGPGIIGLFALNNGAKYVVQADINSNAIENAKKNNIFHNLKEDKVMTYLSDCFDKIPQTKFDLIIFNIPFHCDKIVINDPLQYAFYDPDFISTQKFLQQARNYSHEGTRIVIAFSNKGDTSLLENIFKKNNYEWELWRVANQEQQYDNRLYLLK